MLFFYFFFQAEDGIRDLTVTGVQTCALPISDGMLYAGTGDGGGGGDPDGNGQNKHALLGKLLRLDVSGASGYAIPPDNPGASDTSFAPGGWAYGLRNTWGVLFVSGNGALCTP